MPKIKIPHFSDNYFEIIGAFEAVKMVFDTVFENLNQAFKESYKKSITPHMDEDEWRLTTQIFDHYRDEVGPQYLAYAFLLMLTATLEKNIKVLKSDGFEIKNKRKVTSECISKGITLPPELLNLDKDLNDLFEMRNYITHAFGTKQADPKNKKLRNIIQNNAHIKEGYEGKLFIEKSYLESVCDKLSILFREVGDHVYPT